MLSMGIEQGKVFLPVEGLYRTETDFFGVVWKPVVDKQLGFILERPLLFEVITKRHEGPSWLVGLAIKEWWEAEAELRAHRKPTEIEELVDMSLLLLTADILNPSLLFDSTRRLVDLGWNDTIKSYCDEIGMDRNKLIPTALKKIEINRLRNPAEVYMIDPDDSGRSLERLNHNWQRLKENRHKMKRGNDPGWWKKTLRVDKNGWIRDRVV